MSQYCKWKNGTLFVREFFIIFNKDKADHNQVFE